MEGLGALVEGAIGNRRAAVAPPKAGLTAADLAADAETDRSAGNIAELQRSIEAEKRPAVKALLQAELSKIQAPAAPAANSSPFAGLGDMIEGALGPSGKDPKWVPDQAQEREPEARKPATITETITAGPVGALEAAGTIASGAVGGIVGAGAGLVKGLFGGKYGTAEGATEAARYAKEVARSLTYEPRTEGGREVLDALGRTAEQTGLSKLAGIGPAEGMALASAAASIPRGGVSQGVRLAAGGGAAEAAPAAAAGAPKGAMGSVVAAGVAPTEQVKTLAAQAQTPAIRQELERAAKKATPYTVKTAERIVAADSLPVPIKLTAGQATQDVSLLSNERNARGAKPEIAARLDEQNVALGENLREIRDRAAPDVFATSRPAMGETIIDAYKTKDAALNKVISANYKALKDANGGAFPMDAKTFAENAYKKLHADLKAEFVPGGIEKQLEGFRAGKPMTFEQFESMRTNLANVMRSSADGNAKQAAALIRDALEELPMPAGAEHLKPLADAARASARERFDLIKADPAYKAVVRGKASADRFLDKYVLNADKAAVETMKANLAHDPVAQQTMTAGALRRLQDRAGLIDYSGNFSPAGYNKALEGLGPKMAILFEPESKKLVEQLGTVAGYVKGQPAGSFVNNSNTAVAMMADASKFGLTTAADMIVPGAQLGTRARKIGGFVKEQMDLSRSLQTGAGLRLKEVAK